VADGGKEQFQLAQFAGHFSQAPHTKKVRTAAMLQSASAGLLLCATLSAANVAQTQNKTLPHVILVSIVFYARSMSLAMLTLPSTVDAGG
jgi:hypothetical protein